MYMYCVMCTLYMYMCTYMWYVDSHQAALVATYMYMYMYVLHPVLYSHLQDRTAVCTCKLEKGSLMSVCRCTCTVYMYKLAVSDLAHKPLVCLYVLSVRPSTQTLLTHVYNIF